MSGSGSGSGDVGLGLGVWVWECQLLLDGRQFGIDSDWNQFIYFLNEEHISFSLKEEHFSSSFQEAQDSRYYTCYFIKMGIIIIHQETLQNSL